MFLKLLACPCSVATVDKPFSVAIDPPELEGLTRFRMSPPPPLNLLSCRRISSPVFCARVTHSGKAAVSSEQDFRVSLGASGDASHTQEGSLCPRSGPYCYFYPLRPSEDLAALVLTGVYFRGQFKKTSSTRQLPWPLGGGLRYPLGREATRAAGVTSLDSAGH